MSGLDWPVATTTTATATKSPPTEAGATTATPTPTTTPFADATLQPAYAITFLILYHAVAFSESRH